MVSMRTLNRPKQMFTTEKFSFFLFFAYAYNENSELTKTEMFTAEKFSVFLFLHMFTVNTLYRPKQWCLQQRNSLFSTFPPFYIWLQWCYIPWWYFDGIWRIHYKIITQGPNLDNRFEDKTFDIYVDIGKLFNFHSLLYPCMGELMVAMDPLNIETSEDIFVVLNNLSFID